MWIYLNHRFVKKRQARVSVFDHGFLYGDGVFETLRARRGRVLDLSSHLKRLHRSAEGIGLSLPDLRWSELLQKLLRKNRLREALIRVSASRGPGAPTVSGLRGPARRS